MPGPPTSGPNVLSLPSSTALLSSTAAFLIAGFAVFTVLLIVFSTGRQRPRALTPRQILLSVVLNGILVGILLVTRLDPSELLRRAGAELQFVSWFRQAVGTTGWQLVIPVLLAPHALVALLGWASIGGPRTGSGVRPGLQDGLPRAGGGVLFVLLVRAVGPGVVEELLFRLVGPAALLHLTNSLVVSLCVPLALFALGHRYQGWGAVLRSAFLGAAAMLLYLVTGEIVLCILMHALWNAYVLLLIPALLSVRRRRLVRAAIRAHRASVASR
jgi:hypothetical protein